MWWALVLAWRRCDMEHQVRGSWKRLAYACRYGRAGLEAAARLDSASLQAFCEAVGEIVEEEHRKR